MKSLYAFVSLFKTLAEINIALFSLLNKTNV